MSDLDEPLGRAARELRGTGATDPSRIRATRSRVVASTRHRSTRRRRAGVASLALGAVFTASLAWAASTGRLPHLGAFASKRAPSPALAPRAVPAPRARASTVIAPPPQVTGAVPQTDSVQPAPPPLPRLSARAPLPPRPAPIAPDALYRAAHDAHFARRDFTASLAAWDRYLAAAPDGRFAPEARYNRAIALARLGRRADAIAALRPLAAAPPGAYRQREAALLIEVLGARP